MERSSLTASDRFPAVAYGLALAGIALSWWLCARTVQLPLIYADEAGYLLQGRFYAGAGPPSGLGYFPGYGLALAPLFRVADDIEQVFRLAQLVNLALLLGTFGVLTGLVRRLIPGIGPYRAAASAAVTCVYPAYIGFSALALSETFLLFGVAVCWLLALEAFRNQSPLIMAGMAGVACALVAVHPRAIIVPLGFGLTTAWLGVRREFPRRALGAALGAAAAATLAAYTLVRNGRSLSAEGSQGAPFLDRYTRDDALQDLPIALAGHSLYLVAATGGFVALGVMSLVQRRKGDAGSSAIALVLLLSVVLSAAFMAGGNTDKLIYGRYNEAFFALPLALGLGTALSRRLTARDAALMLGPILVLGATFWFLVDPAHLNGSFNRPNVLGLLPLFERTGGITVWPMVTCGLIAGGAAVLLALTRPRSILPVLAMALLFVGVAQLNTEGYFEPSSAGRVEQGSLVDPILLASGALGREHPQCVVLDRRDASQWHRVNYRVLLAWSKIEEVFTPNTGTCKPWLLSSSGAVPDLLPNARLAGFEAHAGFRLWVHEGAEQDWLKQRGMLFPPNWQDGLPESARVAKIAARRPAVRLRPDRAVALDITHRGIGSPWPGASGDATAPVRLTASVEKLGATTRIGPVQRIELPATVYPAQTVTVSFVPSQSLIDAVNDQEDQVLWVELIQDGVAWFGESGRRLFPVSRTAGQA